MYEKNKSGIYLKIRFKFAETTGKLSKPVVKLGRGAGKSFPGFLFLKLGSYSSLKELAKKPSIGTIMITGTNGKTTTTKFTSMLLERDANISYNFESNTLNAIVTGLLADKIDLGIFEYGIRDILHAIPDTVCELVNPVGVVYTNISREHSQVAGAKNPFKDYFRAKQLLSLPMKRGVIICNADDPRTAYIGKEKESDVHVTYYGFDLDLEDRIPLTDNVLCPACGNNLIYSKYYMNHRGFYSCKCGFSRPEPDIKITKLVRSPYKWNVTIEGSLYNYSTDTDVSVNSTLDLPPFGIHNVYNVVCAVTNYISFTPCPENVEKTIQMTFKNMDMSILPPGRFEIFKILDKLVGIGQGDNGDAMRANMQFMENYVDKDFEIIYTAPDEGEEEIFEDHINSIKTGTPQKIYVIPGRKSIEAAQNYYKEIKKSFKAEFYPVLYDEMNKKIDTIIELILNSDAKYMLVSGCGPEEYMWKQLKERCKSIVN